MTTALQCQICKHYKGLYKCAVYDDVPMDYYLGIECPEYKRVS